MIVNTLIEGLTQEMVQKRLNSADAKPFLFGKHFPITKVIGFNWKTLQNQFAQINVAADISTDNGSVQRKRRPSFESAMGDIPHLTISREMERSELKDYYTALALSSSDKKAIELIQFWGNDVDFCFRGVQSELEYLAWALLSNAGKLEITKDNNGTYSNEFSLDYDVPEYLKESFNWGGTKATPLNDFQEAVKRAKKRGLNPKFGFLNLGEFYKIATNEQVIKACSSYVSNAVGASQVPDLEAVNAMLSRQAWLNGLQLIIIDQTITREHEDGTQTSENPFVDNRIVLSETPILGSTQYDILPEKNDNVIRAVRNHTIIRKYGTVEPQKEITIGEADAVPVLDSAYRNVYIKTDGDW